MGDTGHEVLGLRVVRGRADADELAALMVVLLALCALDEKRSGRERQAGGSHWWSPPAGYRAPCSWQ
jgi:hypothetical protein